MRVAESTLPLDANEGPSATPAVTERDVLVHLVQTLTDAWNAHDARAVAALYAPDFEGDDIALPDPQHGPDAVRRLTQYYLRAFPDLKVTLDSLVIDGDQAVMIWTLSGTHRNTFMNIPPTGRYTSVRGTTCLTVRDGLVHRATRIWDLAGLLRGMGLLPEL